MKKTYSKNELQAEGLKVIESHEVDEVFATTDGNIFLRKSDARLHAGKGNVLRITKPFEAAEPEPKKENKPKRMNANDAIAFIATAFAEELEQFADDDRKTVIEAYQARLEELTKKEDE